MISSGHPKAPCARRPSWLRRLASSLLMVCLSSALGGVASADEPLTAQQEQARQESLELFRAGKNAFKAGDFDAARELFLKAWAKFDKEPFLALALARTYDSAAAVEKALIYYEHFQRLAPANADYLDDRAKAAARANAIREELKSRPGTLKFKGLPSGARLEVDGKLTAVDASGELKVQAGQHAVRVTMDKRVPFEWPAVAVGPGEVKTVEVVLVAPVDPSTLPRDHTWTWVAGGTTAAGLVATSLMGFLLWREHDQYNARFDGQGKPRDATRADYPINGQPCRVGVLQAGTSQLECAAAVREGNDRIATIRGYQIGTAVAGGATLLAAIGTAVAYFSAPVAQTTAPAVAAAAGTWSLRPLGGPGVAGAQAELRF